ncbi:MAG: phosphate/phosphite/phosphonate ABC transporter substrate-binding protein [Gammaproteobacteria bacterium]|nr:phosphate/phosphite/phosphonate ABC transporter substrate-binding protein [Gammaproteobacteria bacterium]MCW8986658.1 phosphate/phosphite/phosphonate ABC transporter substrate-binding protein [Gammaproteobacteria bacterium]MCW9030151.1 phosphate/phosphite/phosphonate ABC transporter substrate-binding protein [Gammaproteobacteria bacterium]
MFNSKFFITNGLLTLLLTVASTSIYATTTIGVLAPRGELKAMKQWRAFGEYVGEKIGDNIVIKPYSPKNLISAATNKEVEFMLSNPTQAVILQDVHGATPQATLNKLSGSQFAGVIVAKKGSGITKAEDLKGKKVMSLKFRRAAGAYTFQTYHLYKKGIDPHKDFASFQEGKKQDDLVLAVKAGIIDAAFVRTGILENMQKENKIKMDEFVVVDKVADSSFPFVRSTTLYPEWYMSSLQGTDVAKIDKVKKAILALKPEDEAAMKAKINGFIEPVSMDGIKAALKVLKIEPYNK